MGYLEITITETACNSPRDMGNCSIFNRIVKKRENREEIEKFLTEHYGKPLNSKNKRPIFVDKKDGSTEQVGFLYSFWNRDVSHNSKNWFQTDWIEVCEVEEKPVLI